MQDLVVDGLTFSFPDDWPVSKYDEWSFYRNRWIKIRDGVKALDLVACSLDGTTWLIEVKDYRRHARTKAIDLADEVTHKVFDTLAALLPAWVNSDDALEQNVAACALRATKLRVVLHLEQPAKHSKLFPRAINPINVQQRLRQQLKPIDAHPVVCETTRMGALPWTAR